MSKRARGAPQFAQRSTKSHTGCPTSGLTNAVQKPQRVAQSNTIRIGFNKTIKATSISSMPTMVNSVVAVAKSVPVNCCIHLIQSALPCKAKIPCPKKDPNTATLKTH